MPDSYFQLDVNFFDHPKVVGLGDLVVRLELSAIGYANRLMTDGHIAPYVPGRLIGNQLIGDLVVELIEAVLWHEADVPCPRGHTQTCPEFPGMPGWRIHDFLEHNRSKAKRLEAQKAERDRKAAWREKQRKPRDDAQSVHPDEPIPGDAGVPRDNTVPETRDASASETSGRRLTETETETETKDKINTVVAQARPIDDVAAIFVAWQDAARKPRARLDDKRRRIIKRALKHYPADDLIDAVQGWQHSPHHCGQNDTGTVYNDLELLLRDSAHIERFRDLWRDGPPRVLGKHTTRLLEEDRRLAHWAAQTEGGGRDSGGMAPDRRQAQRELPRPGAAG